MKDAFRSNFSEMDFAIRGMEGHFKITFDNIFSVVQHEIFP